MATKNQTFKLNPMLDIAFKLLFGDRDCEMLLISLLEAVLEPPTPIKSEEVRGADRR